jgi:hypothetical protein
MTLRTRQTILPFIKIFCVAAIILPALGNAGTYVVSSETYPDIITHPSGYTGVGGVVDVEVCIDASAADAVDMEIPVQNIIKQINKMTSASPNLFRGIDNNIPSGAIDFESLVLHELGHCTGLGHPNLGIQTGVSRANADFTQSGNGVNDTFSFDAGTDAVIGSSDDLRDDDQNLHWFEKGVNNPFMDVANPQSSNFSRDVADLPADDEFVANAGRAVGALLGFADTEAVMQQGQSSDEDQRQLQADDVATYRMAMTGLDEIASTADDADDYTINMVYGGVKAEADTSDCDIVILSNESGFGSCSIGVTLLDSLHIVITTAIISYNSNIINWYFNTVEFCSAFDGDLSFSSVTHSDTQSHEACNSISYGPGYVIGEGGVVTATAPHISLGPGTSINGTFRAINAVP